GAPGSRVSTGVTMPYLIAVVAVLVVALALARRTGSRVGDRHGWRGRSHGRVGAGDLARVPDDQLQRRVRELPGRGPAFGVADERGRVGPAPTLIDLVRDGPQPLRGFGPLGPVAHRDAVSVLAKGRGEAIAAGPVAGDTAAGLAAGEG